MASSPIDPSVSSNSCLGKCHAPFDNRAFKISLLALAILCIGVGIFGVMTQPRVWQTYAALSMGVSLLAGFCWLVSYKKICQEVRATLDSSKESTPLSSTPIKTEVPKNPPPSSDSKPLPPPDLHPIRQVFSSFSAPKVKEAGQTTQLSLFHSDQIADEKIEILFRNSRTYRLDFTDLVSPENSKYLDSNNLFFYSSLSSLFLPLRNFSIIQGKWNHDEPYYFVNLRCSFILGKKLTQDFGYLFFWKDISKTNRWKVHFNLHFLKEYTEVLLPKIPESVSELDEEVLYTLYNVLSGWEWNHELPMGTATFQLA